MKNSSVYHYIIKCCFLLLMFTGIVACGSSSQNSIPIPTPKPPPPTTPEIPTTVKGFYEREPLITTLPPWIVDNNFQDNNMLKNGLLDITLYNGWLDANQVANPIDPSGVQDSIIALQQAINDARDYHLVAFIPSGTYLISDTLKGMMKVVATNNGYKNSLRSSVVIVGSSTGSRPIIRLQANATGFADLQNPKAVVHMWSQCAGNEGSCIANTLDPDDEQASIAFNQIFKNINIDCAGNSGAIGLRNNAAQGSTVENVKVFATGCFAGFYNLPSRVSGAVNIAVDGGKYGIINQQGMHPVIVGATLNNQQTAAIHSKGFAPMTIVGFKITKVTGPVIRVEQGYLNNPASGTLNLIDGSIELATAGLVIDNVITSDVSGRDLVLQNVFIKNGSPLINSGTQSLANSGLWTYIKQYTYSDPTVYPITVDGNTLDVIKIISIDGQNISNPHQLVGPASILPKDLVSRHLLSDIPDPESATAKNVLDADIGAFGDGVHDDTAAIQNAIDQFKQVFIPKGIYRLTAPLVLHNDTKLFGVSKNYSELFVDTDYWCPSTNAAMVITDNDALAETSLTDIQISVPVNDPACEYFTAINWQAGNRSVVKDIFLKNSIWTDRSATMDRQLIKITNGGGGRWYFINAGDTYATQHSNYRVVKVFDNDGVPLIFYGLNAEHSQGDMLIEFNNTANISVYGIKTELTHVATGVIPDFDFMNIINSKHIAIFGHAAAGAHLVDTALYRIIDSDHIMITNVMPKASHNQLGNLGDNIVEINAGVKSVIADGTTLVSLYKKGYGIPLHAYDNSYTYCHAADGLPLQLDIDMLPVDLYPSANPAVLFIHGGGWRIGGRKTDQVGLLQESTGRGYVGISMDYRLTSTADSNNNPIKFQLENAYSTDAVFPTQIYDVKCAVKWLKENADRFNIDPDRIGVVGGSAGGHLTTLLATTTGYDEFGSNHLKPLEYDAFTTTSQVTAAVNWFGPSALNEAYINGPNPHQFRQIGHCLLYGNSLCLDPLFDAGTDPQFQSLLDAADPITYLQSNAGNISLMPPIHTIIGDQDEVVAQSSVILFNDTAIASGLSSSLTVYPNVMHSFKPAEGNTLTRQQILDLLAYPETYSFFGDNL